MAFSSRGHNIFNNQYKMATIIYDREGVEREGRGARSRQSLPRPEEARTGCLGGGQHRVDPPPPVRTPRPAREASRTPAETRKG